MDEVREAIGIDKVDMSGKMVFIEEHHNADANLILHAVISHCTDENSIVCFVLFHNTFGHFHNVGMKLGYNLRKLCNSSVRVVEPFKMISKNVHNDQQSPHLDLTQNSESIVRELVNSIKNECLGNGTEDTSKKKYILIDDLSHLLDIGLSIQDVWLFFRYLRSFTNVEPHLSLYIGNHVYKPDHELCQANLVAVALRCCADLIIEIRPLETGYSKNVSGKMVVCWKSQQERLKFKWSEEVIYLFKLFDRQVKLFAPGSSLIM